jgi:hypothetical protein
MVRMILRTLAILLAIGLVSVGLYWAGTNDSARVWMENYMRGGRVERGMELGFNPSSGNMRGEFGFRGAPPGASGQTANQVPPMRMNEHEGERGGSGNMLGLVRNTGIIALVTVGIALVQQGYSWITRRKRAKMS